jgi:hypothetical protein
LPFNSKNLAIFTFSASKFAALRFRMATQGVFIQQGFKMPRGRKRRTALDEKQLTKGQLRKLKALRKSLGEDIANSAFSEWLSAESTNGHEGMDRNAAAIQEAIEGVVLEGKARIPRGGYFVRRGRGRVIVEHAEQ